MVAVRLTELLYLLQQFVCSVRINKPERTWENPYSSTLIDIISAKVSMKNFLRLPCIDIPYTVSSMIIISLHYFFAVAVFGQVSIVKQPYSE